LATARKGQRLPGGIHEVGVLLAFADVQRYEHLDCGWMDISPM
jgi:hypothetical protein